MRSNFLKIQLFLSIILFIFCGFVFFYVYRATNNFNKESQLTEITWQTEASRRDEIKSLDRSVRIIEGERVQLETHFAKSSDIVPFLDTIEGLAPQANIKSEVTSVDILKDKTGLLVGMKASGTFDGLYKFLTLLENSPYELEFVSMDMQRDAALDVTSKNAQSPTWNEVFKVKLLSFIQ